MACISKSDWISWGKKWKDLPKPVQQLCRNKFKIPEPVASKILPSDELFMHALLDFPLPRGSPAALAAPDTPLYFSKYAPNTVDAGMILRLHHLALLPVKLYSGDAREDSDLIHQLRPKYLARRWQLGMIKMRLLGELEHRKWGGKTRFYVLKKHKCH
ncbi:hypothetical protein DFH08DRAFT_820500 [Mycena albidolilacea]|uniref:Uncharacterized protein n=1 Tax=Mycena albidolilacea TaxID=1033008 RepID=A0AAD6ZC71_9AGAR|nr:hypothetical protein DFH08DRAFT_820500 [Mycena albidolilacea]